MSSFYTSVERHGNYIHYIGYENSRRITKKEKYEPELFVLANKKTKFRTVRGQTVAKYKPGSMRDCKDFIERTEADNFPIYGMQDYVIQYISERFPKGVDFDPSIINVSILDIETEFGKGIADVIAGNVPITAITIKNNIDDTFYAFGCDDYDASKTEIDDLKNKRIVYTKCKNEVELLRKFLEHWKKNWPDVVTGWNSNRFDIPVLINRVTMLFGEESTKAFSPWGYKTYQKEYMGNVEVKIPGIVLFDYIDVFKKFAYKYGNQESYKLDHIAYVVLKKKKHDYSEYEDLEDLRKNNHQKYIDYNIRDVDLIDQVEVQEGFIGIAFTIVYKAMCPLSAAFGTVVIWDSYIYSYLRARNIAVPPKNGHMSGGALVGGFVKEVLKGQHEDVASTDLDSLYPHLMMQYNMSPEMIVDEVIPNVTVDDILDGKKYDIPEDRCMAPTGQLFDKSSYGFIPQIIEDLYAERSEIKKKMIEKKVELENLENPDLRVKTDLKKEIAHYANTQQAIKIMMNSLYGAMSNKWFRYFDLRIANAITVGGQLTIKISIQAVNDKLNAVLKGNDDFVIAADTDSLYITLSKVIAAMPKQPTTLDERCDLITKIVENQIIPLLNKNYEDVADRMNAYAQRMSMKQEIIADKAIWVGKKRYIANVLDDEGVRLKKPKLKVVGIESVKSSTPEVCRKLIEKTLKLVVNEDEETVQAFIADARKNFSRLPVEEVAFPRGVTDVGKWIDASRGYKSGCPIHVRASILYNNLVKEKDLAIKYGEITNGDKMKFVYMKKPNPVMENVMGFISTFPSEFELKEFVDYDLQFDKTYVEPMNHILDAIGWTNEKQYTLEDFFE